MVMPEYRLNRTVFLQGQGDRGNLRNGREAFGYIQLHQQRMGGSLAKVIISEPCRGLSLHLGNQLY